MAVEKGEKGAAEVEVEVEEVAATEAKEQAAGGDMITLKSSYGKTFEVSKEAAERLSKFLEENISSGGLTDGVIQLEKVGSEALEKVVDYFNKHADSDPSGISSVDAAASEDLEVSFVNAAASMDLEVSFIIDAASEDLEAWDRKLVDDLSMGAFFDLVRAAHYLGMAELFDVTGHKFADMMKGKTPDQIRKMFNIKNDYTPEQEEEVRRENAWAFEDEKED